MRTVKEVVAVEYCCEPEPLELYTTCHTCGEQRIVAVFHSCRQHRGPANTPNPCPECGYERPVAATCHLRCGAYRNGTAMSGWMIHNAPTIKDAKRALIARGFNPDEWMPEDEGAQAWMALK